MKKILIINLGLLILAGLTAPVSSDATTNSLETNATMSQSISASGMMGSSNNVYLNEWRQNVNSLPDLSLYSYQITKSSFVYELENYYSSDGFASGISAETSMNDDVVRTPQFIHINSNDDFEGFPGSGSQDDPYIIEGFSFNYPKANLIQIQNTDVHVIIRNNALVGFHGFNINILINNAQHISIQQNNLTLNSNGIKVMNSSDIVIKYNMISDAFQNGIFLENVDDFIVHSNQLQYNQNGLVVINSTNGLISSNEVWSNWGTGVSLAYSDNNLLTGNAIFENGGEGLVFVDSDSNTVLDNEIYENGFGGYDEDYYEENSLKGLSVSSNTLTINAGFSGSGFFMDPSFNNLVINNSISDNNGIGLYLEESGNTIISGNDMSSNGLNGIFFKDSHNNVITDNDVNYNGYSNGLVSMSLNFYELVTYAGFSGSGFFMDPSEGNVVSNNNMNGNYANGLVLQESTGTDISGNNIGSNGLTGVFFQDSHGNDVTKNEISNNGEFGLGLATMSSSSPFELKLMAGFSGSGFFMDPSHNNTVDGNVLSGNTGNGLFLLESDNTDVSNNQISSNGGDGVFVANSSHNGFESNVVSRNGFIAYEQFSSFLDGDNLRTYAGFSGSGFFMDPSEGNVLNNNLVMDNAATGVYFLEIDNSVITNNIIGDNGFDGILFENSNMNTISHNAIEYNGFSLATSETESLSTNAGFSGSGFFMDPSFNNVVDGNNFTGNAQHGFFSEASSGTEFTDNRVMNHSLYGVVLDKTTSDTTISGNNFENNNDGGTQAYDDGIDNSFASNFWSDHDNTDNNNDGIADEPYFIDGSANNVDAVPSNIPNGLNFYEASMKVKPRTINLKSHGRPIMITVYLDDGFIVKSLDLDKLWLNGSINPYKSKIKSPTVFKLVFDRKAVVDLIKLLDLHNYERDSKDNDKIDDLYDSKSRDKDDKKDKDDDHHSDKKHHHSYVVLQLTGLINDDLLDITANDVVKVKHRHHHHYHNWLKFNYKTFYPIAGSIGVIPVIKKRKNGESEE